MLKPRESEVWGALQDAVLRCFKHFEILKHLKVSLGLATTDPWPVRRPRVTALDVTPRRRRATARKAGAQGEFLDVYMRKRVDFQCLSVRMSLKGELLLDA